MDKIFTQFLSYSDISVNETELVEDAFYSDIDYGNITELLRGIMYEPSPGVVSKLLEKI